LFTLKFSFITIIENITLNITLFKTEVLSLEIIPYLTINNLKQRLYEMIGIAPQNQRLLCNGVLLFDKNKINSYGLDKNSKIELLPYFLKSSMNIKITNEEITNFDIDANPECLVKYLKKIVEFKHSIKVKNQLFIFEGKDLDDNKKLSDYKLFNNAFIYMGIRNH
jgi:hypothetical protein